jgi:hypothetical protein
VNISTPPKPIRESGPPKRTTTSKSSFVPLHVLPNCASLCNRHKVLLKKKSSTKFSASVTSKSRNCDPPSTFPIWRYMIKYPVPPSNSHPPSSPPHNDSPCLPHSFSTNDQTPSDQPGTLYQFTPIPSSKSNITSLFTPLESSLFICPLQKNLSPTSPWFPSNTLRS